MIAVNANIMGILLGFLVPKLVVHPTYIAGENYTEAELETYKKETFNLMFLIAAFSTLVTAFVILTFRSKPRLVENSDPRVNNSNKLDVSTDSSRSRVSSTGRTAADMNLIE